MSYSLNGISLSEYDIIPGRIAGSNIAISGIFDLPKRIGKTYQTWDEDGSVEPFVDADELFFSGRDLVFNGFIKGPRNVVAIYLDQLKADIAAYDDLVVFHSDQFGDFEVKILKIDPQYYNEFTLLTIKMREPVVDLSEGVIPEVENDNYTIDNVPLKSFGMSVSKVSGRGAAASKSKEYFTVWDREGYHVNGVTPNEVLVSGYIKASSILDFKNKIKALWKLFTIPGLRLLRLNNYVTIHGFMIDGFQITNFNSAKDLAFGDIELKIINVKEVLTFFSNKDEGGKLMATDEGKLLII